MADTNGPARILLVDDEIEIVRFVQELLGRQGYTVKGLSDSRQASQVFSAFCPDLCILDFQMPEVSGSELLDTFRKADPSVEVVFLTAQEETRLAVDVMKRGASDFLLKPVELYPLFRAVSRALEHRRLVKENEAYRLNLEELVLQKTKALNEAVRGLSHVHSATLDALAQALDFRDQSTSGHSKRVASLTMGAARAQGIDGEALVQIEHGALLHDIGKLKIPDSILWKPTGLDEQEWTTMRMHPVYGYEFLRNIEFLRDAADLVYSHHEKYDGSGYPRRLMGRQIPFGARIFAIVDAVDAMVYKRPYNTPVSFREAAIEVRRCAGTHFDPELVESTLEYLRESLPKKLTE